MHSHGPVTVTDVLPAGLTATSAGYRIGKSASTDLWDCSGIGTSVLTCTSDPVNLPSIPFHQEGNSAIKDTGPRAQLGIVVEVSPTASGTSVSQVSVSGGGALAPASVAAPITVSSTPASSFGFESFDGWFSNPDGTADTQAGSHPYEATFSFNLNTIERNPGQGPEVAGAKARTIDVNLPPGLVGDPTAVPQCPRKDLNGAEAECPVSTLIGFDSAVVRLGLRFDGRIPENIAVPVFNMVPPPGAPAEFGFVVLGTSILLDAGVRSGGDYGITEHVNNITQLPPPSSNTLTLWGEPADPRHDFERFVTDRICSVGCSTGGERRPFLTLPTACGAPPAYTAQAATWETLGEADAEFIAHDSTHTPAGFSGCDHLGFKPSINVAPDTSLADSPAGLTVEVNVPQEGLSQPEALATSNIKDTTVTLPPGVAINPGQAAGLAACQAADAHVGDGKEDAPSCPNASKVGTVQIATPLLKDKLEGNVYVLQSNPPNLQLLVAASGDGVNLKLVGDVHLDEGTGQITTTFKETPELPFTNFKLSFSGGAQAALTTPVTCGVYSTTSDFTPWSTPSVGDVFPLSNFQVTAGPGGGPCLSSPLPFSPSLIAGATTDQAGGFTDFSLLLQNGDGQQRIEKLQFQAPAGLSAMISQVPLCGEPQAARGTCPSSSRIGHAVVASGPGPYPLVLPQPGKPELPIYLTGPYEGAPFGLSIVTPVQTGPFDLGTIVTRAKIEVDPYTAQITVTTDPLPQVVKGVPTDLRTVNSVIDRPGFMFNPTNCNPASFSGTAWGTPPPGVGGSGATAPIGSRFQVGSCRSLEFKPDFKVSATGNNSKRNGAALTTKIVNPPTAPGEQATTEAGFSRVKVELPKQLPSRLTTLQKACLAATFEVNPATCPPQSVVGHAKVITPLLPVPLEGPAYFISHGGEAFPDLTIVLQGDGVTNILVGTTFISKSGVTSTTFKATPDVPFSSFELTLPQGPYSALAANTNLCSLTRVVTVKKRVTIHSHGHTTHQVRKVKRRVPSSLSMPTEFVAQNGLQIRQNTPIAVTGCAKATKAANARRPNHSRTSSGRATRG
ncbi:MAG TPA: hypothetical protein VHY83_13710 [Solirubrobacteraceae bacterium]|jgi:hypothetical protein|nr:hypothetical protein [Solirubrobacteraceae bacterium]